MERLHRVDYHPAAASPLCGNSHEPRRSRGARPDRPGGRGRGPTSCTMYTKWEGVPQATAAPAPFANPCPGSHRVGDPTSGASGGFARIAVRQEDARHCRRKGRGDCRPSARDACPARRMAFNRPDATPRKTRRMAANPIVQRRGPWFRPPRAPARYRSRLACCCGGSHQAVTDFLRFDGRGWRNWQLTSTTDLIGPGHVF